LARLLWRLLRRFALWIAAKPIRAADLLVALAVVLSLASLVPPRDGEQLAFLPVPLDYSNSLDCLTLNIYHEARGEPQDGQLAVAKVVMNRVSDPRFPNDVCGVVTDGGTREPGRCQFSWWCDGKSDKPRDAGAWRDSRSLAKDVLAGKFDDPTGGALWYHADYVQPNWQMDITKGPKIGRHIFYASAKR
jgi:spore germination cell wall hydrolase CwlJ-like protein